MIENNVFGVFFKFMIKHILATLYESDMNSTDVSWILSGLLSSSENLILALIFFFFCKIWHSQSVCMA